MASAEPSMTSLSRNRTVSLGILSPVRVSATFPPIQCLKAVTNMVEPTLRSHLQIANSTHSGPNLRSSHPLFVGAGPYLSLGGSVTLTPLQRNFNVTSRNP